MNRGLSALSADRNAMRPRTAILLVVGLLAGALIVLALTTGSGHAPVPEHTTATAALPMTSSLGATTVLAAVLTIVVLAPSMRL